MKLGLMWGYWGAQPPEEILEVTRTAEDVGFDAVWTAESWGSDVFSPLAYVAAVTSKIRLGTSIVQMSARTPTATAMHAMTLDHLSEGRVVLGLGVSGPQVVEGWYGQPSNRPLARTREYVEILRRIFAREEHLDFQGEFYQHPYRGEGSSGLGKPLKIITHPLRREIPIWIGAEGPKNVSQTADIADGWLPLWYSPWRPEVYADQISGAKDGFEIAANVTVKVTEDVNGALQSVREFLGFYIGGMGAKGQNYHTRLAARFGLEEEALKIQDLFLSGRRAEAIEAVPKDFADEISLVGPPSRIRERLAYWEKSPVTMINVSHRPQDELAQIADIFHN